jgi:succinoglycan biosynthesis transport protein ExoP
MTHEDKSQKVAEGTAAVPPGLAGAPTMQALGTSLKRRWRLASLCAVLGTACAALLTWFFMPPAKHTVQSLLHVEAQTPWVVYQRGESKSDFQSYQRTQIALVKSRFVLNAALRDPEVAGLPMIREPIDPIGWLQSELLVDFSMAPEILKIAMKGDHPEQMRVLVAKITRAYLDEIVKREDGKRRERHEKLKEVHERYQEMLRTKRRTLRELVENVGTGDPQTLALKQRFAQEQLAVSEKELLQVESELRKMQTELALRQSKEGMPLDGKSYDADLEELAKKDPVVEKLFVRKALLEQEIIETVRVSTRGEKEPRVLRTRQEIAGIEANLTERRKELRPSLIAQLQARLDQNQKNTIAALGDRIEAHQELKKTLVKDIDRLAVESRSLNKGSLDIESYRQEIAQIEETAKKVGAELEALTVEQKAVARVTELESAFVTKPDDIKRRLMATVAAAFAGFLLAALGVGWWEYRSRRIQTPAEIVHGLGIKLVGTVPPLDEDSPDLAPAHGETLEVVDVLQTNVLDATRAMLLHTARHQPMRVILVTSAVACEGKTTLASRLAASLARAKRKTLLIDCDLRKPTSHLFFSLPRTPGVSDVILGHVSVDDAIQHTSVKGLSLIAAGPPSKEALQALAQESFANMLKEVRDQYEFIILDSCPVLPVADSLMIGQQADGAILSLLHDVSQMHKVYAAYQLMSQMGIRILGAVLNGLKNPANEPEYRYAEQSRPVPDGLTPVA